ncbi:ArsR/SmtB family transcription factor [Halovivax gelatinilyticus]|uniref:ArsR/SmtB family transcription factor n=1 Tax=Halovivax gelatinilyticus TaxID=2961597 RepID=UPI0020CA7637|nr:helix-turn-helix domain-containing protein [Halovivax gelatinilyticus]
MARLFPLRSETPQTDGTPRVVDLDDEDADAVFGALSSTTARKIYATLDDEPATPSDVAEAIDSSIQNVRYHLDKLEDAGLVDVVDTWYSSRGNEMSVYATANGPLIVTSDESRATQLKQAVSRYVGGIGILGAASLFVQAAADRFGAVGTDAVADDGEDAAATGDDAPESQEEEIATDDGFHAAGVEDDADEDVEDDEAAADDAGDHAADDDAAYEAEPYSGADEPSGGDGLFELVQSTFEGLFSAYSPGSLFFLGGVLVLSVLLAHWYVGTYRPLAHQ